MVNLAVIGAGDWGKNLIRNFSQTPDAVLKVVCDVDDNRLKYIRQTYPDIRTTKNLEEVLSDKEIQGVAIAAPVIEHFRLAEASLKSGKHTYVEKPLTLKASDAQALVNLAKKTNKILMVGHLLKYHPAVAELKRIIASGEIGEIYYLYSQRLNLGKVRKDENALWSFAPHDIAVILYLLDDMPVAVSAQGAAYLQKNIEDVAFANFTFPNNIIAHIHLSWLDPHKTRKLTIVGSKKMVVFDDMEPADKIKIYDKGADKSTNYETYAEYISLRFGDVTIPRIKLAEPLNILCKHFIDCIRDNKTPLSDGQDGLRVVKLLESASQSLKEGGKPIVIAQ